MRPVIILFLLSIFSSSSLAAHVPGEIIVKFRNRVKDNVAKKYKAKQLKQIFKGARKSGIHKRSGQFAYLPDLSNTYVIKFDKDQDIFEIIKTLKQDPDVIYAHPNGIIKKLSTTPNDTSYSNQWAPARIGLEDVWDVTQGSSNITIAVIDTGVDYDHEDLSGKVILGRDYVNGDNDPEDDDGHGTHVAGIAAAIGNNSTGMAGIDWGAKILVIKVLDAIGSGSIENVALGIRYAADNGADVINLSLGDYTNYPALENAIDYADALGVIIVAAAGNDGRSTPMYPAAYSNVLAVASTDADDVRSVWNGLQSSNYGSWINIAAPGGKGNSSNIDNIYSTYRSNTYIFDGGTSMAAPHIAGVVSLILNLKPALTRAQVFDRIESTAVDIDALNPGYDGLLGAGRINAAAALPPIAVISSPATSEVIAGTTTISGTARAVNLSSYTLAIGSGAIPASYTTITTGATQINSGTLSSYTTTGQADGTYTLKLTVEDTIPETAEVTTTFIIDNTNPTSSITYPANQATLTDSITIQGTAADTNINYFILEYSSDGTTFNKIDSSGQSITAADLLTWNTAGLSGPYTLRLTTVDRAGNSSTDSVAVTINNSTVTSQSISGLTLAAPNPFDPSATPYTYLTYTLNNNINTSVFIFDITGRLVFKGNYPAGDNGGKAGQNLVPWNGRDNFGGIVPNGVYFFKVAAGGSVLGRGKIIVLD
ncbi:S8 family serine peptidase [Candidatus Margulisiibacteriota bacterium]